MRVNGHAIDPAFGFPPTYNSGDGVRPRYNTIGSLKPVYPRPVLGEKTIGIICTGQSVMANWGTGTWYVAASSRSHQANIYDGRVYPMQDPSLGADGGGDATSPGTGGSPASALGDKLITRASSPYDRVTVCNVAFGSTSSTEWADATGNLATGLKAAWALLKAHGYANIVILHQQGEADANDGISQAAMTTNLTTFNSWRLGAGIDCPMMIAQATFSYGGWTVAGDPSTWTPGAAANAIRAAQAGTWNVLPNVIPGIDADGIRGPTYRTSAHWSTQAGCIECARQWAELIV